MKVNAGNLKKGQFLIHNNEVWQVMKTEFYSPGKGSALMRTVIKNLKSGRTLQSTYKSNEQVETVEVETRELQFLYKDATQLFLMDPKNYEQYQLNIKAVETVVNFIKEGEILLVMMKENEPISIRAPKSVQLKVVEAGESARGNTVTNPRKTVTVETGAKVLVPMAIKEGDIISVKPENGEYIERVSSGK